MHHLRGHADGCLLLLAKGRAWRLIHLDDLRGVPELKGMCPIGMRFQLGCEQGLIAHEDQITPKLGCRQQSPFDEWSWALVASHRIYRDFPSHSTAFP